MGGLTNDEISSILKSAQIDGVRMMSKTSDPKEKFIADFVDIDEFLDVLYSLLDSGNYIKKEDNTNDDSRFIFTQEYPNFLVDEKQIVSVEIQKRTLANLSSGAEPFSGTTVYRPMYLGQEKDSMNGGINLYLQNMYDNEIKLTCWSTSLMTARRLASLLESLAQKYYYILRKYAPIFIYTGRGDTSVTEKYGDSRYFGIPIIFFVRTNERFILKESELRTIKIKVDVDTSL